MKQGVDVRKRAQAFLNLELFALVNVLIHAKEIVPYRYPRVLSQVVSFPRFCTCGSLLFEIPSPQSSHLMLAL